MTERVAVCDWAGLQPGAHHPLPEHRETTQGHRESQRYTNFYIERIIRTVPRLS